MPPSKGQVLGNLGKAELPGAIAIGSYFGAPAAANMLGFAEATGALADFAAIAGGVSMGLALAWTFPVAIAAIAVLVASDSTLEQINNAIEQLSPFTSPGVLSLVPISPFLSPNAGPGSDPLSFAKGAGPFVDLGTGLADPSVFGKVGAVLGAGASVPGAGNDVSNLYNGYFPSNGSNNGGGMPGPTPTPAPGPTPSPSPRPTSSSGGNSPGPSQGGSPPGLPYDNSTPGNGDMGTAPTSAPNASPSDSPNTSVINLQDLGISGGTISVDPGPEFGGGTSSQTDNAGEGGGDGEGGGE